MADDRIDVLVVGAGVVGLGTALMAAEGGARVVVVAAEPLGGGSTGRSVGAISRLHGTAYSRMRRETATKNAAAYTALNAAGFAWLESAVDRLAVPHERRDALLVAGDAQAAARIDDEHLAARQAGLRLEKQRGLDLPLPAFGALRLPDQLVVDPRELLNALAIALAERGVVVAERERVVDLRRTGHGMEVATDRRVLLAARVVLATGTPVTDRGAYFAKTQAYRLVALRGAGPAGGLPVVTSVAADGSRTLVPAGDDSLGVIGEAHPVGVDGPESRRAEALDAWARRVPGWRHHATWSGQDYRPYNPIAFVGRLTGTGGRVLFATGFDGWGLTNGAGAAIRISADLLGRPTPDWATTIGRRATRPRSVLLGASGDAAAAARRFGAPRLVPVDREHLAEGHGVVHRQGDRIVATSRVGGVVASVDARCTRLGGSVTWNDLELGWDCPVCGSRFSPDGAVLEGGAREPLAPVPVDPADWGAASYREPSADR